MKLAPHIIALLCLLAVAVVAGAAEMEGNTITLDEDDIRICVEGGGCVLITLKALEWLRKAGSACVRDA